MAISHRISQFVCVGLLALWPATALATETDLITKPSHFSARETIDRFEAAVKAKEWVVFSELDFAATAAKFGRKLPARTLILYGNPKTGTAVLEKTPTLAIDFPQKAVVWEDDMGKVWLSYNSSNYLGDYVFPRHGLPAHRPARRPVKS